jgi:hypothetical protein
VERVDQFAAIVVAVLIILTSLGDALVLFVYSIVMLIIGLTVFRQKLIRGGTLAATIGLARA